MQATPRLRLDFLDGIRGLAALYVMLGHAYIYIRMQVDSALPPSGIKLFKLLDLGHYAVAVFIVLSGYCLMLPVARSASESLAGGWFGYISRRAGRIMPPYYAALVLSIILVMLFPQIAEPGDLSWEALTTHALLIHNLFPTYIYAINGPLWSVAMEWQIYFFLPFLLLPIWRRFGNLATLLAGFVVSFAPVLLLPEGSNFEWTHPWYIALFALGMVAAAINFSGRTPKWLSQRIPWQAIVPLLAAVMVYLLFFNLRWSWENRWFSDSMMGLTTAALLIMLTQRSVATANHSQARPRFAALLELPVTFVLRFLQSRYIVALGAFSYSLYLIHEPVLLLISSYLMPLNLSLVPLLAVQFLGSVPVTLVLCYGFYWLFERPFVKHQKASKTASSPVAVRGSAIEETPSAPVRG